MKKIDFSPGDVNYRSINNSNSAFDKRGIPSFSVENKSGTLTLFFKDSFYSLTVDNSKPSYLHRNQTQVGPSRDQSDKNVQFDQPEVGIRRSIDLNLLQVIHRIVSDLEHHPNHIFEQVKLIQQICKDEGIQIPTISGFDTLDRWEDFFDLIKSIAANDCPYKFELFVAALSQWVERLR